MHALGLDVGTTNTKAVLVAAEADGASPVRVVRIAALPTPPAAQLATTVGQLVRSACAVVPPAEVVAVGIASMAETGVPVDAEHQPLGDWLRWDGRRATVQADLLAMRLGREALFAATGVRASAKVPLATWLWLRETEPERFAAMAAWSGAADLVGLHLTGLLGTDPTLAGRTMAYRLDAGPGVGAPPPTAFDADLLAEVGLTPERVPRVLPPGSLLGTVDASGAALSGLRPGTPVAIAGHDHQVGAWAAGVRAPGQAADSLGTAEAVVRLLRGVPDAGEVARAGMSLVRTVAGDLAIVAGASSAGGLIDWWRERSCAGDDVLATAAALSGPTDLVALPYLAGRQSPAPDPGAQAHVPAHGDLSVRTRAVLDAVCLQARWMAEVQVVLAGEPAGRTVVVGGTAVPAWLTVKRQVGPHPMALLRAAEPVATGAAMLAARRAGLADPPALPVEEIPPPDGDLYGPALARLVAAATAGERRPPG